MMKNNKEHKTALPELRFPEFRDSEGWILSPLSQLLDYERPDSYIVSDTNYCNDGTPVLTANKSFILGYTKEDYGICNNIPVVIFDDFTADKKYVDFPFKVKSSAIKILRPKKDNNLRFAFELMNCIKFETAEHKRYYISSYQTQTVPVPQPNEQNKIANCLSSLDDLISAVTDKIEALKEHKKGLMQQLFPAEGSTVPTLRFPEFKSSNKWHEKRIKDLKLEIITGFAFKGNDISELRDGIRLMRGINITEGYVRHTDDIDRYYLGDTERLSKYFLKVNDLVIGMDGSKVGKNMALITDVDSKSLLVQRVARLRSQNVSLIKYLFQQINSSRFFSYVDRINTSSGIPHISQKQIEEFLVWIPDDRLEIKKIGDVLISIDDQIFAETQKLEQLKAHKKGLMQRLFPKI